eukprot:352983-Chlamydomonas_euryale.AAC.8
MACPVGEASGSVKARRCMTATGHAMLARFTEHQGTEWMHPTSPLGAHVCAGISMHPPSLAAMPSLTAASARMLPVAVRCHLPRPQWLQLRAAENKGGARGVRQSPDGRTPPGTLRCAPDCRPRHASPLRRALILY